jgi:hypothetical protein
MFNTELDTLVTSAREELLLRKETFDMLFDKYLPGSIFRRGVAEQYIEGKQDVELDVGVEVLPMYAKKLMLTAKEYITERVETRLRARAVQAAIKKAEEELATKKAEHAKAERKKKEDKKAADAVAAEAALAGKSVPEAGPVQANGGGGGVPDAVYPTPDQTK